MTRLQIAFYAALLCGCFSNRALAADQPLIGFGDAKLGMSETEFVGRKLFDAGSCTWPTNARTGAQVNCYQAKSVTAIENKNYVSLFVFSGGVLQWIVLYLVDGVSTANEHAGIETTREGCDALESGTARLLASRYGKFDGPPVMGIVDSSNIKFIKSMVRSTAIKSYKDRYIQLVTDFTTFRSEQTFCGQVVTYSLGVLGGTNGGAHF